MRTITGRLIRIVASRPFFYGLLAFFVFEALWFVFSAIYPMAFDEAYHFEVTKIYAQQWSPFLNGQPAGGDTFGALARDPSFLYHYLFSFPYRVLAWMTDNQTTQVIVLRLMNVGLVAYGIVLFRRFLLRVGLSTQLTHMCLTLFVLVPVVPMLAAHINYDNLLFLMVAWIFLLSLPVLDGLRQRKIVVPAVIGLLAAILLTSVVKYAVLPIALGIVLFIVYQAVRSFWGRWRTFWLAIKTSYTAMSTATKLMLAGGLLISSVFFIQRYGVNIYVYHTPVPECGEVLSKEHCEQFAPWARNERLAARHKVVDRSPGYYTYLWLRGMHYRLFFTVNGPTNGYANGSPLPIPSTTAKVVVLASLIVIIVFWRRAYRIAPYIGLCVSAAVVCCVVLWWDGYSQYLYTSSPVAINGRYLIPVLLPMAAVAAVAWGVALRRHRQLRIWLAAAVVLLFLQGGGIMTFILRSDASWYWSNKTVTSINNAARRVLAPIIIEGENTSF